MDCYSKMVKRFQGAEKHRGESAMGITNLDWILRGAELALLMNTALKKAQNLKVS